MNVVAEKKTLRDRIKGVLAAMTAADREGKSVRVCDGAAAWFETRPATRIMIYAPMLGEVRITPLGIWAAARGVEVCVPRVDWAKGSMDAVAVGLDEMKAWNVGLNAAGKAAPVWNPEMDRAPVEMRAIDTVFVPGIAFDRGGNRLGRGKGFYDRFLGNPALRATTIGVAFDEQIVSGVPHEKGDVPVQAVVTPSGLFMAEP